MEQIYSFDGKEYRFSDLKVFVGNMLQAMMENFKGIEDVLKTVKSNANYKENEEYSSQVKFSINKYKKLFQLTEIHKKETIKELETLIKSQDIDKLLEHIEKDIDRHSDLIVSLLKHVEKYSNNDVDKRIVDMAIDHDLTLVDLALRTLNMQKEFISGSAYENENLM